MKVDWKSLSIALILSIILNGFAGTILLIDYNEKISNIYNILESENNSDDIISITIAEGDTISLRILILIFVFSIVISTIIVYFAIYYLRKRKG